MVAEHPEYCTYFPIHLPHQQLTQTAPTSTASSSISSLRSDTPDPPVVLRPLIASDLSKLTEFLISLSQTTRKFWSLDSFDENQAKIYIESIAIYDKLRFVVLEGVKENGDETGNEKIVGFFEFSFGIPDSDIDRFKNYGIKLDEGEQQFRLLISKQMIVDGHHACETHTNRKKSHLQYSLTWFTLQNTLEKKEYFCSEE